VVLYDGQRVGAPPISFSMAGQGSELVVPVGGSVTFVNKGTLAHQPEEAQGLVTWDTLLSGQKARVRPLSAGVYTVHDRLDSVVPEDPATETFTVMPHYEGPMACPAWKAQRVSFDVTWATGPAPDGLAYQVKAEVMGENRDREQWWLRSTRRATGTYRVTVPPAVRVGRWAFGTFGIAFEARLVDRSDPTRATGWAWSYSTGCVLN